MIKTLKETKKIVETFRKENPKGKVVLTSGGYDPLHAGHTSSIVESRNIEELKGVENVLMIVSVNGDRFLELKKGKSFLPHQERLEIVDSIKGVDITVRQDPTDPDDMTQCETLEVIKPDYFTKGGDRDGIENIPEWDTCVKNNIEIITNVGKDKIISSTQILQDWVDFINKKNS
jgi:glycerol-3-phosphate cytidylyltransferase-like family protein